MCLHLGTLIGPWGVDREPLRLRLRRRHWVMLAPHAFPLSSPPALAPSCQLRRGCSVYVYWGRGGGAIVSVGAGWCVRVCVLTVQVFPVATPATPAPFLPRPDQGSLSSLHTGSCSPAACQSQRRGVGPLHRGRTDTYQGYSPHQPFPNLYITTVGSCLCPRPWGGSRVPPARPLAAFCSSSCACSFPSSGTRAPPSSL